MLGHENFTYKNIKIEMKNTTDGINSRMNVANKQISELKN